MISIHAPHTRSDPHPGALRGGDAISIHAPHTRSDHILKDLSLYNLISIHAPHTRSDEKGDIIRYVSPDFNPRSSYEERRQGCLDGIAVLVISIHAPHTRSDNQDRFPVIVIQFQSTLLIRGATRSWPDTMRLHCIFQSTLLIRGATLARLARLARKVYFNPRSSYEERRCKQLQHGKSQSRISIHAPHTRSDDLMCIHLNLVKNDFNPRSSYEERQIARVACKGGRNFNPRSSYEERQDFYTINRNIVYFNPRSSYEERRYLS